MNSVNIITFYKLCFFVFPANRCSEGWNFAVPLVLYIGYQQEKCCEFLLDLQILPSLRLSEYTPLARWVCLLPFAFSQTLNIYWSDNTSILIISDAMSYLRGEKPSYYTQPMGCPEPCLPSYSELLPIWLLKGYKAFRVSWLAWT